MSFSHTVCTATTHSTWSWWDQSRLRHTEVCDPRLRAGAGEVASHPACSGRGRGTRPDKSNVRRESDRRCGLPQLQFFSRTQQVLAGHQHRRYVKSRRRRRMSRRARLKRQRSTRTVTSSPVTECRLAGNMPVLSHDSQALCYRQGAASGARDKLDDGGRRVLEARCLATRGNCGIKCVCGWLPTVPLECHALDKVEELGVATGPGAELEAPTAHTRDPSRNSPTEWKVTVLQNSFKQSQCQGRTWSAHCRKDLCSPVL